MTPEADHAVAQPAGILRSYILRYVGYRYAGLSAGIHRGLPAPHLALIVSLDAPMRLAAMPDPAQPAGEFAALTGYYDQAHMAREWRSLAGCSPATWLATEELSFVQDGAGGDAGD